MACLLCVVQEVLDNKNLIPAVGAIWQTGIFCFAVIGQAIKKIYFM